MCLHCQRPVSVCYCAALTSIETRSRIVILQHPREEGMAIGTARMAHLCLPNSSLHVGAAWDGSAVLQDAAADPARPPVLLYPGPGARDILQDPPPAPVTLIVVDGTWSQARKVVRTNPKLASLPRYAFIPPAPSRYRIRREPRAEYVSTLEALMHVLGAIEGDAHRFEALMRPMNAMVEAQLAAQAAAPRPRRVRPRPKRLPYERLPAYVREFHEDLVLVFGDANAWPRGTPERRHGDELIYWVAQRPSTGERFSFIVKPRIALAPYVPHHTGLPAGQLEAGGAPAEMLKAFGAFVRSTDVICSWGHHGLRLFQDLGGRLPGPFLDMQQAARDLTNQKVGSLELHAERHGIAPLAGHPDGRAGLRLGLLASLLASWRALPRA
jgi:DTW domain-containing protein YfiP